MEGSNYWGYGYKTQHSYSEVAVNHLKKAKGEIWPKRSEKETTHTQKKKKNYEDEDKKSAINKKLILRLVDNV